jgi:hypothetical protein
MFSFIRGDIVTFRVFRCVAFAMHRQRVRFLFQRRQRLYLAGQHLRA